MFATIFIFLFLIVIVAAILAMIAQSNSTNTATPVADERVVTKKPSPKQPSSKIIRQAEIAEETVEAALRQLQENRYFVFRDLIIPSSSKSMSLTQIDHVVVCQKGIFCIETKSSNGNIYGYSRSETWKQYVGYGSEPYPLNSPFRQNRHHVKSLEALLANYLRAPVHSYVSFPNAKKVVVDGKIEDMSPKGVVSKINKHDRSVYDNSDVEKIAKILAHAGSLRNELRDRHIEDVREYLEARVSKT